MKKFFFIILILLLGWGGWHGYQAYKAKQETPPVKMEPGVAKPDPSNATFQFEDGPIKLTKGTAESTLTDSSAAQETSLTDTIAYGDINNDGKNDAAFLLVQSGVGSGVFLYAAAYVSGVVQYKGSNAIFIGDRVTPKSISIATLQSIESPGTITITYLDRKPEEPFSAEPTITTVKHFIFKNGELVEK